LEKELEKIIECTCVGKEMTPAGGNFKGIIKSQRWVEKLSMLILTFENGYSCNAQICKLVKE